MSIPQYKTSSMSYNPQQEGPKININFYDNIHQVNLPFSFIALYNLIPSIISVAQSYFIHNFTITYAFQGSTYEITNENTYAILYNLAQAGKVDQIKIELKQIINIPFQQQQFQQKKQIEFDAGCKSCSTYPLYGTVYRCARCKFFVCERCEEVFGEEHEHALIQIRNEDQMKDSSNLAYTNSIMFTQKLCVQSQMSEVKQPGDDKMNSQVFINSVKKIPNKLKEIPDKIKGFFSNVYNGNTDVNTLVKQMRKDYSLVNYTDIQIENALKQSNYNKEEALLKLLY